MKAPTFVSVRTCLRGGSDARMTHLGPVRSSEKGYHEWFRSTVMAPLGLNNKGPALGRVGEMERKWTHTLSFSFFPALPPGTLASSVTQPLKGRRKGERRGREREMKRRLALQDKANSWQLITAKQVKSTYLSLLKGFLKNDKEASIAEEGVFHGKCSQRERLEAPWLDYHTRALEIFGGGEKTKGLEPPGKASRLEL